MNSLRRRISSMVITLVVASMVLLPFKAAAEDNTPKQATHSLTKSARALQFAVGSNFNLYSFSGSTLSYKKHTQANVAWRLGVSLSSSFDDYQRDELRDTLTYDVGSDDKIVAINLELVRIKYGAVSKRTAFFWGVGPQTSYDYRNTVRDETNIIGDRSEITSKRTTFGLGLSGVLGVEWFINHSLSLSAEYQSELVYQWSNTDNAIISTPVGGETASIRKTEIRQNTLRFTSQGVMFGLSVYF